MLTVMDAFAECEHSLLRERQRYGIALTSNGGLYGGKDPYPEWGQPSWSNGLAEGALKSAPASERHQPGDVVSVSAPTQASRTPPPAFAWVSGRAWP